MYVYEFWLSNPHRYLNEENNYKKNPQNYPYKIY